MWLHGLSKWTLTLVSGMWVYVFNLENASLSILVHRPTRSSLLSADKASNIFTALPHGYINFPAWRHHLLWSKPDWLSLSEDTTQVCYIAASMLVGSSEQEIATTLDLLVRHLCVKGWKIGHRKGSGLLYQWDFWESMVWAMSRSPF